MDDITSELIRLVYPLNLLSAAALDELRPSLRVQRLGQGRLVFEFDETPSDYSYVIHGGIALEGRDGRTQAVGPLSEGECIPLPYMVPSPHRARTTAATELLLIDRKKLIEAVGRPQGAPPRAAAP